MIHLYKIFAFLLITSLTACVSTPSNLAASSDEDQDIGLGGTGMLASTGNGLGGTGIIGEITGFGSIFVNGIEIEYDNKTPFTMNGKTVAYQQLAIGDVVEVLTTNGRQHTDARVINVRHEVIGEVDSVNPQTHSFTLQGQTIIPASKNHPLPITGDRLAVSGFRINSQEIQATRITPADNMPALLRTETSLPFSNRAARWLIQTHISNGQLKVHFNSNTQVISIAQKTLASGTQSGIKIMRLQKSTATQVSLERIINSAELPRGRSTETLLPQQNNNIRRIRPMSIMNAPQTILPRGAR